MLNVRRYERDGEAVILVDADWRLKVTPCFQDLETEAADAWSCLENAVEMTGRVQVFIPEDATGRHPAQLIGGTWSSPISLYRQESGGIMSLKEVPLDEAFGGPVEDDDIS